MWAEAVMLAAFVGGRVGEPYVNAIGKQCLVSSLLAGSGDHLSIIAAALQACRSRTLIANTV